MIRLFLLLLAACLTGNCMKQQYDDIRSSERDDTQERNAAVRQVVRSATSSSGESCGQYQQLTYPCDNHSDSNTSVCADTGPVVRVDSNRIVKSHDCCCDTQCLNRNNDVISEANESNLLWLANQYNRKQATLIVNWTSSSSSSGSASPVGYQLWVSISRKDLSTMPTLLRCICLPPSITSYAVNVSLTLSFNVLIKLFSIPTPNEQLCPDNVNNVLSIKAEIPHYCWDLKGASVEKCGQMFPSPPQNLTVTGTPVNQSSIMLYISWRPPVHYAPDIEAYEISINGNYYCSNGTTLHYVTVQSADVSSYTVKISASSGEVTSYLGVDRGCCYRQMCCGSANGCNYWSPRASITYSLLATTTATTTTATTSSSTVTMVTDVVMTNTTATDTIMFDSTISTYSSVSVTVVSGDVSTAKSTAKSTVDRPNRTTLIIVLAVLITTAIVLLLLAAIMIVYLQQQKRRTVYRLAPTINESLLQKHPPKYKVFIVTDNSDLEPVRELCHHLVEHDIGQKYYQYVEYDRDDGPGQLGIPAWTQKCFNEHDMVLFVCNHGFNIAWENEKSKVANREEVTRHDPYTLVISTVRQLFEGYLTEHDRHSKYAVILLQESDRRYIPPLLKNIRSFLISDQEGLARYILQIPKYVAPHCNE